MWEPPGLKFSKKLHPLLRIVARLIKVALDKPVDRGLVDPLSFNSFSQVIYVSLNVDKGLASKLCHWSDAVLKSEVLRVP